MSYEGDKYYWEQLGMLTVPSVPEQAWERKRRVARGQRLPRGRLITSEDSPHGRIDAAEIERIARKKILLEG